MIYEALIELQITGDIRSRATIPKITQNPTDCEPSINKPEHKAPQHCTAQTTKNYHQHTLTQHTKHTLISNHNDSVVVLCYNDLKMSSTL